MIKEKVDSIKQALVKVDKTNNKKSLENLVTIAILLIITIIAINFIWKDDKKKGENKFSFQNEAVNGQSEGQLSKSVEFDQVEKSQSNLEVRLASILSKIDGVGEVQVLLTYSETNKVNPVYNEDEQSSTTEETDTSGGKRVISSTNSKKEVVQSNNNIVTRSISSPQIQGAVVLARGAGDIQVKTDIIQAVSAATGLSTYKIQVFEMN